MSSDGPASYVLRVQGALDAHWAAWFDGLTLTVAVDGTTALAGTLADQAALHGVLRKIRDLGLALITVERRGDAGQETRVPATPSNAGSERGES